MTTLKKKKSELDEINSEEEDVVGSISDTPVVRAARQRYISVE